MKDQLMRCWIDTQDVGCYGITKDAFLKTSEHANELQSTLHTRRGGEYGILSKDEEYLRSRKKVAKTIKKALKKLMGMENSCSFSPVKRQTLLKAQACRIWRVKHPPSRAAPYPHMESQTNQIESPMGFQINKWGKNCKEVVRTQDL